MAVDQESRNHLHNKLTESIGEGAAAVLMEHLPPVGWADVATKADLDHLGETIRLELRAEMANLRREMAELRTELHKSFGEFRDEIRQDRVAAQRQLIFVLVVALVSLVTSIAF